MNRALLDTDMLSEILKRKDPRVMATAAAYASRNNVFTFTVITVHEILYGLQFKGAAGQIRRAEIAFTANEVITPTFSDFARAGVVRGNARRLGHQLAMGDCLIGAIAERLGIPLATGNVKHFEAARSAGMAIVLENWRGT